MPITISPESPAGADAQALLRALDERLAALYDPPFQPVADREALITPGVTFLVARRNGAAVGCGGLLRHGRRYVELVRMFVVPDARGLGVGHAIVEALERIAHDEGFRTSRLATGNRQVEAIALYEACGYRRRDPWDDRPDDGVALYFEHSLVEED